MAVFVLFIALALLVAFLLYRWSVATFDYFERRKIPFVKPWPLVGGMWAFVAGKAPLLDVISEGYRQFPESRLSGFFNFRTPGYVIHDPELVKLITVRDFDHFVDHSFGISVELDPFMGRALFFSEGQRWRQGRTGLSPAFTGSKMRNMFELLSNYCDGAMKRLVESAGGDPMEMEAKDLLQKFGNDIMTSISFGMDIDSVRSPDNEFLAKGKRLATTAGIQGFKFFLATLIPRVFTFFKITITPRDVVEFYQGLVSRTISYRESHNIVRPDFIHLLVQARKNELKQDKADETLASAGFSTVQEHLSASSDTLQWTDLEITSTAASFFFGGMESTSNALCFALYELCLNPEIQDKLRDEIDAVQQDLGGDDGKLSYEAMQKMQYLDMVVTETLRLWTPLGIGDRRCTRDYVVENSDGTRVTIEKGQVVQIPVQAIHRDPRYYPDPLKFDPERFSSENRRNINRDAYMPFGNGPRNCIGSRLALMQAKCLLYYLIGNFTVEMCERSDVPVQLDKRSVGILNAKNGFWFSFVPRN